MRVHKKIGILAGFLLSATFTVNAQAAAHESRTIYPSDGTYSSTMEYTALGDSIVAGYCGWFCRTTSYGRYHAADAANAFDARVYYNGDAHSGWLMEDIADDAYTHRADIAASDIVVIEGCGNNYLDARSSYRGQSDCTNENVLASALDTCQTHMVRALNTIATYKKASAKVYVMGLYYPGVNSDKSRACGSLTHFDVFANYIVESNWYSCNEAIKRGFKCVDGLAAFNAPDTDTDGNGVAESAEIRFNPATDYNDFNGYYTRVLINNKSVISDANYKKLANGSTVDYLQSDDTHPSSAGHKRLGAEHTAAGF
jgi:lysophospholipase L1-like esterase